MLSPSLKNLKISSMIPEVRFPSEPLKSQVTAIETPIIMSEKKWFVCLPCPATLINKRIFNERFAAVAEKGVSVGSTLFLSSILTHRLRYPINHRPIKRRTHAQKYEASNCCLSVSND